MECPKTAQILQETLKTDRRALKNGFCSSSFWSSKGSRPDFSLRKKKLISVWKGVYMAERVGYVYYPLLGTYGGEGR